MDVLHAYAMLRDACDAFDRSGDHAVAAYVGHGMALLEAKYGIDPEAITCRTIAASTTPAAAHKGGANWA